MQPTNQQLSYQEHAVRVIGIAQGVVRRYNRSDAVTLDGGRFPMLADGDNHTLRISSGTTSIDVVIQAHWFVDPDRYGHAIDAVIDSAFKAWRP